MPTPSNFLQQIIPLQDAIVLNGETESNIIDVRGISAAALLVPATLTRACLSFIVYSGSDTAQGSDMVPLVNDQGLPFTLQLTTPSATTLTPIVYWPYRYIQLVMGSAEGADRILKLVARSI